MFRLQEGGVVRSGEWTEGGVSAPKGRLVRVSTQNRRECRTARADVLGLIVSWFSDAALVCQALYAPRNVNGTLLAETPSKHTQERELSDENKSPHCLPSACPAHHRRSPPGTPHYWRRL